MRNLLSVLLIVGSGCGEVLVPDAGGADVPDLADAMVDADAGTTDATSPDADPADAGFVQVQVGLSGAGTGWVRGANLDCPGACSATVPVGARLTLTASASRSSTFVGWSEQACATAVTCPLTVNSEVQVTAQFELRRRHLGVEMIGDGDGTVSSSPPGIDCGADCEGEWVDGTRVTLSARPEPSSAFVGWTGAGCRNAQDPVCELVLHSDQVVLAEFQQRRAPLTIEAQGAGAGRVRSSDALIDCGHDGSGTWEADYALGALVQLTALPDVDSVFTGWSGDCAGSGACDLEVSMAQTAIATFDPVTFDLTVTRSGPGLGRVLDTGGRIECGSNCSAQLVGGTTMTLTAVAEPNYRFVGWSGDCAGANAICNLTINGDTATDAIFEHRPQLVAGFWHVCATSRAGALRCWGANDRGQLGYGDSLDVGDDETPAARGDVPIGAAVEAVALGFEHTCAILRGGRVRCWGRGGDGRLATGDTLDRGAATNTVPSLLPDIALPAPAIEIVAGFAHTCARLTSGDLYCWGSNQYGQIGYAGAVTEIGTSQSNLPSAAGPVPIGGVVLQVSAGSRATCVRLQGGNVRCFGDAEVGALGYGNRNDIGIGQNNTPAAQPPVPLGGTVSQLFPAVGAHFCVRFTSGDVRCWGSGFEGRLGYGNTNNVGDAITPGSLPPLALPAPPLHVSAAGVHTCMLFAGSDLRCFGANDRGTLGYGDTAHRGDATNERPVDLPSISLSSTVSTVAGGGFFTCARFANDNITCWGDNTRGQLGFGDMAQRGHTPATVPSSNGVISVF